MKRIAIFFIATTALFSQIITTIAGGGPGSNVPALNSALTLTQGAASDSAGNVFFTAQSRVFRLEPSGNLTLIAGTGLAGFSGDGGPATAAQLRTPNGLAVDLAGNIYVADLGNNRIRKITPAGVITTFAGNGGFFYAGDGGPATNAQMRSPHGVAVDKAGNVFIAETGSHVIRKVSTDGNISTVAGFGVAGFSGDNGDPLFAQLIAPRGVVVDKDGTLYIADYGNNRIRKVVPGKITTISGAGVGYSGDGQAAAEGRFSGPTGIALDSGNNLFIVDSNNQRIRKIVLGGNISSVAGNGTADFKGDGAAATSATLNFPAGVAVDGGGNVYIADQNNARIRKVISSGTISSVAGNGTNSYGGDGALAPDAQLNVPSAIARDAAGNLFIADTGNHRIRRVTVDGRISTYAGNGTAGFGGDGAAASAAQLNNPSGLVMDGDGNLYVSDSGNHRVRRITPGGTISSVAGTGTAGNAGDGGAASSAQLSYPIGLAIDTAGNLYVADSGNNRVRRFAPGGSMATMPTGSLNSPQGVAVDLAGNLYAADLYNHRIQKLDAKGAISTVAGDGTSGDSGDGGPAINAQLRFPFGVTVTKAGELLIADTSNHAVRLVSLDGTITTVVGTGVPGLSGDGGDPFQAQLFYVRSLIVDEQGNLYIADSGNQRIRKVTLPAANQD